MRSGKSDRSLAVVEPIAGAARATPRRPRAVVRIATRADTSEALTPQQRRIAERFADVLVARVQRRLAGGPHG